MGQELQHALTADFQAEMVSEWWADWDFVMCHGEQVCAAHVNENQK